jgi:hypothetical protein
MSCIPGEIFSACDEVPINARRGNLPELAGADHPDGAPSPINQYAASGRNSPDQQRPHRGGELGHPVPI